MRIAFIASLAAVALLAGAVAEAVPPPPGDTSLAGKAGTDIQFFATLAPVNSFEWKAAPVYTRLAVMRHSAASALRNKQIPVALARSIQTMADEVRVLLDASLKACAQNDHTGQCTNDPAKAQALLDQAVAALAAIK